MTLWVPQDRDRLGAISTPGSGTRRFTDSTFPALPADESLLVELWIDVRDGLHNLYGYTGAVNWYWFYMTGAVTGDHFRFRRFTTNKTMSVDLYDGTNQYVQSSCLQPGPNYMAVLLDRDNTDTAIFNNAIEAARETTVQDPDLSNGIALYCIGAGNQHNGSVVFWKVRITSIGAGKIPSDWTNILQKQLNPEAPMHPDLVKAIGSIASEYRPGEGLYGSDVVKDIGLIGSNDAAWNTETVDDVRRRLMVPWAEPFKTFYSPKAGYSGDTGGTYIDFGFQAGRPVIIRVLFSDLIAMAGSTSAFDLFNQAGSEYFRLRTETGVPTIRIRTAAPSWHVQELEPDQYNKGGDLYAVLNGTEAKLILSGQHVGTLTLDQAVSFVGGCRVQMVGNHGHCCRGVAWNPLSIPVELERDIQRCINDPERDPDCLAENAGGNGLLDFPLHDGILVNPGDTDVPNQFKGGGTVVISAGRDTACAKMLQGAA